MYSEPDRSQPQKEKKAKTKNLASHLPVLSRAKTQKEKETAEDKPDAKGRTPLHRAALEGNTNRAKKLLAKHPDMLGKQDHEGHTPLQLAVEQGHTKIAYMLADSDPSQLKKTRHDVLSPVFMAIQKEHRETAKALLHIFASGSLTMEDGIAVVSQRIFNEEQTLLHIVALKGYTEIMQEFAKLNFIDLRILKQGDAQGNTPVHLAAQKGHHEIITILLNSLPAPTRKDLIGQLNRSNENAYNLAQLQSYQSNELAKTVKVLLALLPDDQARIEVINKKELIQACHEHIQAHKKEKEPEAAVTQAILPEDTSDDRDAFRHESTHLLAVQGEESDLGHRQGSKNKIFAGIALGMIGGLLFGGIIIACAELIPIPEIKTGPGIALVLAVSMLAGGLLGSARSANAFAFCKLQKDEDENEKIAISAPRGFAHVSHEIA